MKYYFILCNNISHYYVEICRKNYAARLDYKVSFMPALK